MGFGAFQNDAALDFVGNHAARLVQVVTDFLGRSRPGRPPPLSRGVRDLLPLASIARGAAAVAAGPEASVLGLEMHEVLAAERLRAAVAAERTGMSWITAIADTTGPGWTSRHELDESFAALIRKRIPTPTLPPLA